MEAVKIIINDEIKEVNRSDYVNAKTKDLKEFGYNVTPQEVDRQLQMILDDKSGLSVIGMMIIDDIVVT